MNVSLVFKEQQQIHIHDRWEAAGGRSLAITPVGVPGGAASARRD